MTGADLDKLGSRLRALQEPLLRWTSTGVFAGCAIGFCTSLGDVEASTSIGLLFGLLFGVVPAAWLWGRELHQIQVQRDKRNNAAQPRRFNADVGDIDNAQVEQLSDAQTATARTTYYDDDSDDD